MSDERTDALDVLSALANAGLAVRRPGELCGELGVAPPKMSRLLRRLSESGWVRRTEGGGYVLGPEFYGAIGRQREDLALAAQENHRLMERTETEPRRDLTESEMFLRLRLETDRNKKLGDLESRIVRIEKLLEQPQSAGGESAAV